jgi:hypothetical protein
MPTPKELQAEIESGPLSAALAPAWADIFPAEPEPPADETAAHSRWERIRDRFGRLTPDAVHSILGILRDPTQRSRPIPMRVGDFANWLAGRGILRKVNDARTHANDLIASVSLLVMWKIQGDPSRMVDPLDSEIQGMFTAFVTAGIVAKEDASAFVTACTRPCSRLDELGWTITDDDIHAAKAVKP